MTDYETAALFFQVNGNANAALANSMMVVFAMLAAGAFVADKLSRVAAALLVGLFTLFAFGMGNEIFSLYSDMGRLARVISEASQAPGAALGWHGAAVGGSGFLETVVPKVIGSICFLAYIGTAWFFVQNRRDGATGTASPPGAGAHSDAD